ncbi:uncharacterized protein LOC113748743 [Coffea eugenioides]|uniref:uncharacterized protein LOC113748743 n=1 Tax=Coffea eugenioides TaxID=49369 RepID=UPI000F60BCFD|nr:uncharacterized protein LOC113748743 [Coffea eugenioides]
MGGAKAELVRGVFFKTRSGKARDGRGRSNAVEKKGWSSVKSYLCGDECASVLGENDSASFGQLEISSVVAEENSAQTTRLCQIHSDFTEEDTASFKSSEATVTQPIIREIPDKSDKKNILNNQELWGVKQNSAYQLFQQEDAAMTIQSAFRNYLARRSSRMKVNDGKQEIIVDTAIPSPESLSSSIKVQTGDSTGTSVVDVESISLNQPMQKRVRVQAAKLQEDWDDSTVSSTISKMRIQKRIEAATRRERALAYAFAQQLRVCAKKKCTKSNSLDANMSWSWLERWMATRQPESSLVSNNACKRTKLGSCTSLSKKLMDATAEEESCGSNEVSAHIDGILVAGQRTQDRIRPAKIKSRKEYRKETTRFKQAVCKRGKGKQERFSGR